MERPCTGCAAASALGPPSSPAWPSGGPTTAIWPLRHWAAIDLFRATGRWRNKARQQCHHDLEMGGISAIPNWRFYVVLWHRVCRSICDLRHTVDPRCDDAATRDLARSSKSVPNRSDNYSPTAPYGDQNDLSNIFKSVWLSKILGHRSLSNPFHLCLGGPRR